VRIFVTSKAIKLMTKLKVMTKFIVNLRPENSWSEVIASFSFDGAVMANSNARTRSLFVMKSEKSGRTALHWRGQKHGYALDVPAVLYCTAAQYSAFLAIAEKAGAVI
jgi:hypothetical protein